MPTGGPLDLALESLTKIYRDALPNGGPPLESEHPPSLTENMRPWREAVALAHGAIREAPVDQIFAPLRTLRDGLSRFLSSEGPVPRTLLDDIDGFQQRYDEAVRIQRLGNVLPLLAAADRLSRTLAATRELLGAVETALSSPERVGPPGFERLTLILYSEMPLSELADKLRAMDNLYRTVADLIDPDGAPHAARLVKVESGTLEIKIDGLKEAIDLIGDLLRGVPRWMYRNLTTEGRTEALLDLRDKLEARGIDHASIDAALTSIGSDLAVLLAHEQQIRLNERLVQANPAPEPRSLPPGRPMRSLGAGTPDADPDAPIESPETS